MKKLFFTTTSPRHPYKSEKFFYLFQRLKSFNFFGKNRANNRKTCYKRMLVLKQFFLWYYSFLGNRQFTRFMKKIIVYNRGFVGIFSRFVNLLELHVQVILVRANFVPNLKLAKTLIMSRLVFLNGHCLKRSNVFVKKGDIVELLFWQLVVSLRIFLQNYCVLQNFRKKIFLGMKKFYIIKRIKSRTWTKFYKKNLNAYPQYY